VDVNPERTATELIQCLSQDKKPLGLLLGAGCPYSIKDESGSPLVPDIDGITKAIKADVCTGECTEPWEKVCQQLSDDHVDDFNIEHILSRVRGLRDLAGNSEIRGLDKEALDKLEKAICEAIKKCVNQRLKDKSTPYHSIGTWIGSISRSVPVEIFTTNYDLLLEQALEELRTPYFDGFLGAREPFFDPYAIEYDKLPPRWARVWKIHGSINWRSGEIGGNFMVWRTSVDEGGDVVIHPSHLKYEQSRKMPYLALMDRLRKFISTPSSALILIGYSFRDQHLNDAIIQSLQGSPSSAVFALMHGRLENYATARSIAVSRSNLSLIAGNGAIIGTREMTWEKADEQPDSDLPAGTIEWSKETGQTPPWQANFKLGDFVSFGAFLQGLSGIRGMRSYGNGR